MTHKQLACVSAISVAYLRDIEHGCANMTINKLLCIAKAFGLSFMKLNLLSLPEEELMKSVYMARARPGMGVGENECQK